MALSSDVVWNVRPGGSETNGGGRRSSASGDNYILQDAAHISVTDGVTNGTTTITSASANFEADVVGHLCYVAGGSGSVTGDWYEIASRSSSTTIVVDRSTGLTAGTGVTLKIGGALATPGLAANKATVSGHYIGWKDGTYTISTSTPGSGGPVLFANNINVTLEGYSATMGDQLATPTLDAGAVTGVNLFAGQGSATQEFICCKADGQAGASNVGFVFTNPRNMAFKSVAFDCVTGFNSAGIRATIEQCFADTCSTAGFTDGMTFDCDAKSCGIGFNLNGLASLQSTRCLARQCTTDGFVIANNSCNIKNGTSDGNGQYGFNFGSGQASRGINLVASNNTTAGYFCSGTVNSSLINCAHYNNTRSSGTFLRDQGSITLSAQPYVTAGSDFRPNTTTGGGASLRAAGIGVYGQTNSIDVGAVQGRMFGGSIFSSPVIRAAI